MNNWHIIIISSVSSIAIVIRTLIKEREKRKRIKEFKKMDEDKIKAIGNYEKKSNFWKVLRKSKKV
jgi:hypothetical protein